MLKKQQILEQIVRAANKRFAHYSYGKTTMSEIAGDCKMSPGNLYRHFFKKLDIAEQIAEETTNRRLEKIFGIVRDSKLSATERMLKQLLHWYDRYSYPRFRVINGALTSPCNAAAQ
jgi:AcrR family transcriptional regulator